MRALNVRNLRKSYGNFLALRGINLEVEEGEVFALLGPNGAGKTTLIRILVEGLHYDSGEVLVFGKPLSKETARLIGYVPQESIAYDILTVRENMSFYADLYDAPMGRIDELIEEFSLPADKKTKELSGGQRKKLNLAIALLHEPKILILDEPSNGLDVPARRELWEIIRRFRREGKTVIIATHYMEEAEKLADRVAIINEGKVIAVGTVDELKRLVGEGSVVHIEGELSVEGLPEGVEVLGENPLRLKVENPRRELPRIIEALVRAGSEIRLVKVEEPTLEDVFIKLTGRGLE
ncbi:ABC transporter ATP-binding protein [Thermococcus henrietii]|uniref:ABC transporter ATP-binding protein n=1 Tax=Thermococcus henrietii TaxID=2016361 RepID=UPI000C078164|nr:ABC transporter ATP-binding protein [Thermococcus henrietii]